MCKFFIPSTPASTLKTKLKRKTCSRKNSLLSGVFFFHELSTPDSGYFAVGSPSKSPEYESVKKCKTRDSGHTPDIRGERRNNFQAAPTNRNPNYRCGASHSGISRMLKNDQKVKMMMIAELFTYPNFLRIMELLHFVPNLVKNSDCEDIMLGMVGVCVWRSAVHLILAPLFSGNLPELNLTASDKPILIKFQDVNSVPIGSTPQCVSFDLQGSPLFSNVVSENVCSTVTQGNFSIVIASVAPSPAPVTPSPPKPKIGGGGGKKINRKV